MASDVNKSIYEIVLTRLPDEIQYQVEDKADEFRVLIAGLSFVLNSPTVMNVGDELQQISVCFVDSPEDDISDTHPTGKEAAKVFQSGSGIDYAF